MSITLHYPGLTVVKNGLSLLVTSDVKSLTHTEIKIHANIEIWDFTKFIYNSLKPRHFYILCYGK